jgi:hypothetical protein
MATNVAGFPAILNDLLSKLGYHWYPEYMIYEDYCEFNQWQYNAEVRIFDR